MSQIDKLIAELKQLQDVLYRAKGAKKRHAAQAAVKAKQVEIAELEAAAKAGAK